MFQQQVCLLLHKREGKHIDTLLCLVLRYNALHLLHKLNPIPQAHPAQGNGDRRDENKRLVVVTAPHSFCDPTSPTRMCDTLAGTAATELSDFLSPHYRVELLLSPVERYKLDLNRPWAARSAFHKQIIRQLARKPIVLLDIHSFPDEYDDFGHSNLTLLSLELEAGYTRRLIQAISSLPIPVTALQASHINQILITAKRHGVPAALLEFHEGMPAHTRTLVYRVLKQWIDEEFVE